MKLKKVYIILEKQQNINLNILFKGKDIKEIINKE